MCDLQLTLMNWNLYLGRDVTGIIKAHPRDVPGRMAVDHHSLRSRKSRSLETDRGGHDRLQGPLVLGLGKSLDGVLLPASDENSQSAHRRPQVHCRVTNWGPKLA
jgi:hypothetical protein